MYNYCDALFCVCFFLCIILMLLFLGRVKRLILPIKFFPTGHGIHTTEIVRILLTQLKTPALDITLVPKGSP